MSASDECINSSRTIALLVCCRDLCLKFQYVGVEPLAVSILITTFITDGCTSGVFYLTLEVFSIHSTSALTLMTYKPVVMTIRTLYITDNVSHFSAPENTLFRAAIHANISLIKGTLLLLPTSKNGKHLLSQHPNAFENRVSEFSYCIVDTLLYKCISLFNVKFLLKPISLPRYMLVPLVSYVLYTRKFANLRP